jgi:PhnB protein
VSHKVSPIPHGYHSVTPYLIVRNAAEAIRFYERAFGAKEHLRLAGPDGKIGHAELKIGDSFVMLADEHPDYGAHSPETIGGSAASILLYVEDVDAAFAQAVQAGAKEVRPVQDQFYGDRAGTLQDPYGHKWSIATHIEDVPQAEIERRFRSFSDQGG